MLKVALLGDIAFFGRFCVRNNPKTQQYFRNIKVYLSQFDLIVGNLEAPFVESARGAFGKSATVKSHPSNIELLKYLGITHVNLANNHIGDFGMKGCEHTIALLEKANIGWFGVQGKQSEVSTGGEKLALLGYCSYNTNPSPIRKRGISALNYLKVHDVVNAMRNNELRGFLNILAVHSGREHVHMPSYDDVLFARRLAKMFDYVYYGHHPHVVQGKEAVCGSAIFYSLGNFVFDDVYTPRDPDKPLVEMTEANKTGAIGELHVDQGKVVSSKVTPVYLGLGHMSVGDEVDNFEIAEIDGYLGDVGSSAYEQRRSKALQKFADGRRQMRDLKWYLRRLNLNSVGIIFKAKQNSLLYKREFSSKLGSLRSGS